MTTNTEPTIMLTSEQRSFYWREGYLVLDRLAAPDEVDWLREVYDRLFAPEAGREGVTDLVGSGGEAGEAALPQIIEPSRRAPELAEGRYRANALGVARQLLGPGTAYRGEHAIFKPARNGAVTPCHQDEAYWDPALDYSVLSIWIPLQPATVENGCLWFVPGSHRLGVVPHHPIGHDPRVHGLEVDEADVSSAVACPIPAGGCTIHDRRTLHYAGPNRSEMPRRAYALVFGKPPVPRADGRSFPWRRTGPQVS